MGLQGLSLAPVLPDRQNRLSREAQRVKDAPAIILASGLAGVFGAFFPTAQGWLLDQSLSVFDVELSLQSTGLFVVSRLLFLPSFCVLILGGVAMKKSFASRFLGSLSALASLFVLLAWFFQKNAIDQLSVVGIGPSLGLFLLLVSGVGGLFGSFLLMVWPQNRT